MYHSRNLALVNILMEKGLSVFVYYVMFSKEEIEVIEGMGLKYLEDKNADIVFDCFKLKIQRSFFSRKSIADF